MSDPVLVSAYGNVFIYYTCDRDPTSSEPLVYSGYSDLLLLWWNQNTNSLFWCVDNTADEMVWIEQINSNNLTSQLSELGIEASVPRSRTQRTSPAFSTSYRPSLTNDVEVNLTLNFNSGLLSLSSEVDIQISADNSNWVTIFSILKPLSIATNVNDCYTFTVPIESYYKIVQVTGSVASIVSIYELIK